MARLLVWGYPGYPGAAPEDCLSWLDHSLRNGTRVVADAHGDGIALAYNELVAGATTLGLWHMNEPQWTGTSDEVIDSSGNGYHGTAVNGATTAAGWLDRCGDFDASASQYVNVPSFPGLPSGSFTVEAWVNPRSSVGTQMIVHAGINYYDFWFYLGGGVLATKWWNGSSSYATGGGTVSPGAWHHVAMVYDDGDVRLYVDGTLTKESSSSVLPPGEGGLRIGRHRTTYPYNGLIDEVCISSAARYAAEFSPHRYEPGAVTACYSLDSQHQLTAIDWEGTFGPDYGRVRRVYVRQPGGWVPVGEEYPAPPLTGLEYTVSGPELVKVELEPRQDTLHSETPALDWLSATIEPLGIREPHQIALDHTSQDCMIGHTASGATIDHTARTVVMGT